MRYIVVVVRCPFANRMKPYHINVGKDSADHSSD